MVDASQGVEAQTVANCYTALDLGVEVVPVLNKMDLPQANPEEARAEIEDVIGIDAHDAILGSAKTGMGIDEILERDHRPHAGAHGRSGRTAAGDDHRLLVRQLCRRRDAGARRRRRAQAARTRSG